jgi:hypothetical protein
MCNTDSSMAPDQTMLTGFESALDPLPHLVTLNVSPMAKEFLHS